MEQRFGARHAPPGTGDVQPILDQVAAGSLDHTGRDRPPCGQVEVVSQELLLLEQVVCALVHTLPGRWLQAPLRRTAADADRGSSRPPRSCTPPARLTRTSNPERRSPRTRMRKLRFHPLVCRRRHRRGHIGRESTLRRRIPVPHCGRPGRGAKAAPGLGGTARASVVKIPFKDVESNWVPYLLVPDVKECLAAVVAHGGSGVYAPGLDPHVVLVADPGGGVLAIQEMKVKE
jgi:hypothetical protein